jgi:hypothetical protein
LRNNYSQRYDYSNWEEVSRRAKEYTGGLCCFPGCKRKAQVTHHDKYADKWGPIAGREIIGIDCFPLCHYHHDTVGRSNPDGAHSIYNYEWRGVFESRNTPEYSKKLRLGFSQKLLNQYKTTKYADWISWEEIDNL